jgi:glycosyltransferase involved in cell wall biosynthesis
VTLERGPSVFIIGGCHAATTYEYRVLQKQEQLRTQGINCDAKPDLSFDEESLRQALSFDVLYLYRVAYSPVVEEIIARARARAIPVVFDTDDLVFEPELVHWVDPLKTMTSEQIASYYEGVWRYRQTLLESDYVVTSTEYLAEMARHYGKPATVHRNALSQQMIDTAATLVEQRAHTVGRDTVILGYSSGTDTHRRDMAEIADALSQALEQHENVELLIMGPLELPASLLPFSDRIRRSPLVPWSEFLSALGAFDINLAPLETGNPFCRSKSEIKYTEAALLGIPTVASRIGAFEYAIRDGETGFLASATEDWVTALDRLITDAELRHRVGQAARADVLTHYAPQVSGEQLVQALGTIQQDYQRTNRPGISDCQQPDFRPLALDWLVREPIPGSGGFTNILRTVNYLAAFGHRINVYVTPSEELITASDLEVRQFIESHFSDLDASLFKWEGGDLSGSDAVILTHWTTAYRLYRTDHTPKVFYFVQDWEPFFCPMGTDYLRAEQTYKMGFSCITLGQWLTDSLRSWYNADADFFDLAVDHKIYYPRPAASRERPRICFYARPSTPRRLFPLGSEALALIHHARPDAEIILYGAEERDLPQQVMNFPFTNLGILSESELAELFSSCDVGIVLSSTNCSLVPLEMMACRCAVVDLNRDTVRGVLAHENNALLAEPTPEAIADTVLRLLNDEALRKRLADNGYRHSQTLSWQSSVRRVEEILYHKLPSESRVIERQRPFIPSNLPSLVNMPPQQRWHLDAIHRERRRTGARWRARINGWAKRLLQADEDRTLNYAPVRSVGELRGKRRIGQSFVARRPNLHRIDILVGTYGRRNTRDIIFHLQAFPNAPEDLASVIINASQLDDNSYLEFCFPPQPESGPLYFYIESPDSIPGDAITALAYSRVDLEDVELRLGRRSSKSQLIFGLYYLDDQWGELGERPLLRGWGPYRTRWDRFKFAADLLKSGQAQRLWREVVSYWKWKTGGA